MVGGKEKNFRISPDELKAIADQMEALPHVRDAAITTKSKAIAELAPAIKAMRDKGYSVDQIASWITANTKISVTSNTVRDAVKPRRRQVKTAIRQIRKSAENAHPTPPKIELVEQAGSTGSAETSRPASFLLGSDDV
jgi:hypothetical protein